MKKFCYSIIGLFVIVLVSSCSNGSKVLQSPEDAVRERYGLPFIPHSGQMLTDSGQCGTCREL